MQWIASQHTTSLALSTFLATFRASAAGLVTIDDFLSREIAAGLQTFLRSKAQFGEQFGTYESGDVQKSSWHSVPETARLFHLQSLRAPVRGCELDPETLLFLRFRHSIGHGALNSWFTSATGMTLSGTTIPHAHRYHRQNFLKEHTDNALGRKVAVVVYLSDGFSEATGGSLVLRRDGHVVDRVVPEFNRAALFDVTRNEHFIEPFARGEASLERLSIGWWLV